MGTSGYHVFDILWLNGKKVTDLPLEDRRALLKSLPFTAPMRRVDLLRDEDPWERARREGWEGVIAKRKGSPYEHRRSKQWLKLKVRVLAGAGGGRVHRSARRPRGPGRVAGRLLRRRRFRVRREARDRLRHQAPARSAHSVSMRSRLRSRRSRRPSGFRSCVRTGCGRRLSSRCRSSSGRATTSCATRA